MNREIRWENCKVEEFILPNRTWNVSKIKDMLAPEWVDKILAVYIPETPQPDTLYWPLSKNGAYTVKSGYARILEEYLSTDSTWDNCQLRISGLHDFVRKFLWQLPGPSKWKIFLWKILVDALPIGQQRAKRNLNGETKCKFCNEEGINETLDHLFRDCHFIQRVWRGSSLGINCDGDRGIPLKIWIKNWVFYLKQKDKSNKLVVSFLGVLWPIWIHRNDIIFRHVNVNPMTIILRSQEEDKIASLAEEEKQGISTRYLSTTRLNQEEEAIGSEYDMYPIIGALNCEDCWRVKIDGAWDSASKAGCGWAVYNRQNELVWRHGVKVHASSPFHTEALAALSALKWMIRRQIWHVHIQSDCQTLTLQLAGKIPIAGGTSSLFNDLMNLASRFHCLCVSYIPRTCNIVAHSVATRAKNYAM